ncbi:ATP-binding protein, partial [Bifidobacterium animalis]|nr:ATP-binding protein [Bifidobacterium animalis]
MSILYFGKGEEPYSAIVDDGDGMDDQTAFEAMQLAGNSPNENRASNDLGRFGLGLKTASLSQARSLLMTTLQDGARTTLRWDL